MFKKLSVPFLLLLSVISAGPAEQPPKTLNDLETAYRDRVAGAKKMYTEELARSNKDLLASLKTLKSDAENAGDAARATAIQRKIDTITSRLEPTEEAGPIKIPHGPGVDLTQKYFYGVSGEGKRIIFLCDASGSMLGVFGSLKEQLKKSVNSLDSNQEFNIIIYNEEYSALFKDGATAFTAENRKLAMEFIDNAVCTGGTQPISAIDFALKDKPDLLYVLTDGFDQIANFDDVTNAFKNGNPDGKIKVDCIFLESDPDPKLEDTLREVAKMGHGEYTKIRKAEL